MFGTSLLKHYAIQKRYLFRDHILTFMMKVVFMKFMDLQICHLKPTVVLFTLDASWVIPVQRHYCAPKVVQHLQNLPNCELVYYYLKTLNQLS